MPFDCEMVVVPLPGRVLEAAVAFSRRKSLDTPPHAAASFLHLDDRMRFDAVRCLSRTVLFSWTVHRSV